jgi:hypothetical protein
MRCLPACLVGSLACCCIGADRAVGPSDAARAFRRSPLRAARLPPQSRAAVQAARRAPADYKHISDAYPIDPYFPYR